MIATCNGSITLTSSQTRIGINTGGSNSAATDVETTAGETPTVTHTWTTAAASTTVCFSGFSIAAVGVGDAVAAPGIHFAGPIVGNMR